MSRHRLRSAGSPVRCSRWRASAVGIAAAGLLLAGCSGDEAADDGYHPAELTEVAGADVLRVTLTDDAAGRIDLETAPVVARGAHVVVPYGALIYDGEGASWVYVRSEELSFVRRAVTVDRIEGDLVHVVDGLRVGDAVATTGSTELYGEELGIGGSH